MLLALQSNPANALPEKINVRLFDAFEPSSSINVQGPFELLKPTYLRFGSGFYGATIKNNQIELRASSDRKSKTVSVAGSKLILASTTQRGVGLMLPGHQIRYYHGYVQMLLDKKVNKMHRPFRAKYSNGIQQVSQSNSTIAIINTVPVEDYVKSVVGSETLPDCPAEATKAQAILVLTKLEQMHLPCLSDSTQDQAYLGTDYVRKGVEDAVRGVWKERLVYKSRPVLVFFHSCCAGATSTGADVFGKPADVPYLKSMKCAYCRSSNFWQPTKKRIDFASFAQVFGSPLPMIEKKDSTLRPTLIKLSPSGKTTQCPAPGRTGASPALPNPTDKIIERCSPGSAVVSLALLNGNRKTIELSGYQFWIKLGQNFGWDKAPGTRFDFSQKGNEVVISSTGAGHGVGLCQWGAAQQARLGKKYDEILRYYFPGTKIQQLN